MNNIEVLQQANIKKTAQAKLKNLIDTQPNLESISRNYYNSQGNILTILYNREENDYQTFYANNAEANLEHLRGETYVDRGSGQLFTSNDGLIVFRDIPDSREANYLNGEAFFKSFKKKVAYF